MRKRKAVFCVLLAGVLLLAAGCFNVQFEEPRPPAGISASTAGYAPSYSDPGGALTNMPGSSADAFSAQPSAAAPTATQAPTQAAPATAAPAAKAPDTLSEAELLTYFNDTLNKVKTQNIGFTKTKKTDVVDLQLSNSLANSLVDMVKSALLSSNSESQTVPKGGSGVNVFSPSGKDYVSTLTASDITSISCAKSGTGYVIKVAVKEESNPGDGSAMSRAFDYMTVDDVMTVYAPKVGATVERSDVKVDFSGCTAELTVDAAGNIQKYTTYVKGVMNLNNASISLIKSNVAVTLASTTDYTNFNY